MLHEDEMSELVVTLNKLVTHRISYLNLLAPIHSMYSGTISGKESPPGITDESLHVKPIV